MLSPRQATRVSAVSSARLDAIGNRQRTPSMKQEFTIRPRVRMIDIRFVVRVKKFGEPQIQRLSTAYPASAGCPINDGLPAVVKPRCCGILRPNACIRESRPSLPAPCTATLCCDSLLRLFALGKQAGRSHLVIEPPRRSPRFRHSTGAGAKAAKQ